MPHDAVICDRHAGWLLGAEMVLAPNEHLDVLPVSMFLPPGRRLRNPLSRQRRAPSETRGHHRGPGLARDHHAEDRLGPRSRPLARASHQRHRPDASPAWTSRSTRSSPGVERFRGERWVTTLRTIAPLADGRAESPPESILRLYWIDAGLPWPVPSARGLGRRRDDRQARHRHTPTSGTPSSTTGPSGTRRRSSDFTIRSGATPFAGRASRWMSSREENVFGHRRDVDVRTDGCRNAGEPHRPRLPLISREPSLLVMSNDGSLVTDIRAESVVTRHE